MGVYSPSLTMGNVEGAATTSLQLGVTGVEQREVVYTHLKQLKRMDLGVGTVHHFSSS